MNKIVCPFPRLRDYSGCFEDCPDTDICPHRGVTGKNSLSGKRGLPRRKNGGNAPTSPTLQVKALSPDQKKSDSLNLLLTDEERKQINDNMPSEAKYGDVFKAIAEGQLAHCEPIIRADEQAMGKFLIKLARGDGDRHGRADERAKIREWLLGKCEHTTNPIQVRSVCHACLSVLIDNLKQGTDMA